MLTLPPASAHPKIDAHAAAQWYDHYDSADQMQKRMGSADVAARLTRQDRHWLLPPAIQLAVQPLLGNVGDGATPDALCPRTQHTRHLRRMQQLRPRHAVCQLSVQQRTWLSTHDSLGKLGQVQTQLHVDSMQERAVKWTQLLGRFAGS